MNFMNEMMKVIEEIDDAIDFLVIKCVYVNVTWMMKVTKKKNMQMLHAYYDESNYYKQMFM
jgi:hypothetical protein